MYSQRGLRCSNNHSSNGQRTTHKATSISTPHPSRGTSSTRAVGSNRTEIGRNTLTTVHIFPNSMSTSTRRRRHKIRMASRLVLLQMVSKKRIIFRLERTWPLLEGVCWVNQSTIIHCTVCIQLTQRRRISRCGTSKFARLPQTLRPMLQWIRSARQQLASGLEAM